MLDFLFSNITAVYISGGTAEAREGQYVGIKDGRIAYTGTEAKEAARVYDGRGKVVMPGLVNAHTHIAMTLLRGFADDYPLQEWLFDHIFPAEDKLTGALVRTGSALAIAEMLASGTTSFSDMYYFCDDIAQVVAETGISANLSRGSTAFDSGFKWSESELKSETERLIADWHNYDNGRIRADLSIHGEYTSGPWLWEPVTELMKRHGLGMHVHISETKKEHEECKSRHSGLTPVEILERYGALDTRCIAAHCVHAEARDREILASKGAFPVTNPVSNLKLASGVAPVTALLEAGAVVAMGTDSAASNNSLSMFEEMKLCAILQKNETGDASVMAAARTIPLATLNGALSQGRADSGRIEEGYIADLAVLDFEKPQLSPCYNKLSHIVYAAGAGDVVLTMCRGRVLYENGEYTSIDIEKVMREAGEARTIFEKRT